MDPTVSIPALLIGWYDQNQRDLPWRGTNDPYCIWISEIILQQTRVEQGRDYYLRFIHHFPDVQSLAGASEQEVLKLWQGLGYYSRARNLLKAARIIHKKYPDGFPSTYESLINLPGIGEYTAAAILSIAFDQPYPVVDGNVRRVISRLWGITFPADSVKGRNRITALTRQLIHGQAPGKFNQALMEFGALYCKPLKPDCEHCRLKNDCKAYKSKMVSKLPIRKPKLSPRIRYFHYLLIYDESSNHLIVRKRTLNDIWKNLFDFPMIESGSWLSPTHLKDHYEFRDLFTGKIPELVELRDIYHHVLSHQHLYVKYFLVRIDHPLRFHFPENWSWVSPDHLSDFPMPRLITRFLEKNLSNMGNKFPPFRINQ